MDDAAHAIWPGGAGVEFVCSLRSIALGVESDHYHVSFAELERSAVDIYRTFNFGVVSGNPLFHLLVCLCEISGEVDCLARIGCLGRKEDEVHTQIRCSPRVYLKGRESRGAMSRCIIGKFSSRKEIIPGVGIFLDKAT